MKVKIERWGDELVLPLPDHLVEQFQLREGQALDSTYFEPEFEKMRAAKPNGD